MVAAVQQSFVRRERNPCLIFPTSKVLKDPIEASRFSFQQLQLTFLGVVDADALAVLTLQSAGDVAVGKGNKGAILLGVVEPTTLRGGIGR